MKFISRAILMLILLGLIAACGSSNHFAPEDERAIVMELEVEYEVFPGDVLEPLGAEDTRIEVRHVLAEEGADRKYVVLLAGSAQLVRGDVLTR